MNRILGGDHGLRVGVLVNDLGAINIDEQLVVGVEDSTISLANGCVCCEISEDLIESVEAGARLLTLESEGQGLRVVLAKNPLTPWPRRISTVDAEVISERRNGAHMPPSSKRRTPRDSRDQSRRRSCSVCRDKIEEVDYKDYGRLRRFTTDSGKIRARDGTGTCRRHQSQVALAIKRAREMALLAYTGGPRQLSSDERRRSSERPRD